MNDADSLQQSLADQLRQNGTLQSAAVETAFRTVPRHLFVPHAPLNEVYSDEVIATKIAENGIWLSSSSQPAIMAVMLEMLALEPGHRVLEIGAGTGYNAALISQIVGSTGQVVTIDIDQETADAARRHLDIAGRPQVEVRCADGVLGAPDLAPFDRIILTVAAADLAPAWIQQLAPGGRLVVPLMLRLQQKVVAFEKQDDFLTSVALHDGGFMSLRGQYAAAPSQVWLESHHLLLETDAPPRFEAAVLHAMLEGPAQIDPLPLKVTDQEAWGGLAFWLMRDPDFCLLRQGAEPSPLSGLIPCQGYGLVREESLSLLMRPLDSGSSDDSYPLTVLSYGADVRLKQLVMDWEENGRPANERFRLRVYPQTSFPGALAGASVLERAWTRIVIDFLK